MPPDVSLHGQIAKFVSAIEDLLDMYQRGQAAGYDYQYERNGVSSLFMFLAPLERCGHPELTD